jgi:hypothetical protein
MSPDTDDPSPSAELADQVRDLLDRVAALERQRAVPAPATGPGAELIAPGVPDGDGQAATVRYAAQGQIGPYRMGVFRRAELDTVLGADPAVVARELAALASPVRLEIVRALLDGPRTSQQLREALDASSAGHLYHHLKELLMAGVVVQPARNSYAIPAGKLAAVCVITMAAADLAEINHQLPPPPPGPLSDDEER